MLEDTLLLARPCAAFLIAMRIFPHLVFLCVPVSCFSASILGVRTRPPPRSHRIPHPPLSYRSPHRPDRASHPRLPRPRCASRRCCRPGPRSCSLRPGRAAHTPRAATGPAAQPQTGQTQPRRAAPRSPPRTLSRATSADRLELVIFMPVTLDPSIFFSGGRIIAKFKMTIQNLIFTTHFHRESVSGGGGL